MGTRLTGGTKKKKGGASQEEKGGSPREKEKMAIIIGLCTHSATAARGGMRSWHREKPRGGEKGRKGNGEGSPPVPRLLVLFRSRYQDTKRGVVRKNRHLNSWDEKSLDRKDSEEK